MKKNQVGAYLRHPFDSNRSIEGGRRTSGLIKQDSGSSPLVSVVTVVFNNQSTLQRCIDSVQNQSYENVEHIIIDGKSTDGTLDVIHRNCDFIDYYISEPDSGIYSAMNKGIRLSQGRYLVMLNSDDWFTPSGISDSVDALKNTSADFAIGYANVWNEKDELFHIWKIGNFDDRILVSGMSFCHQAVFANRDCYHSAGLYDEKLKISADYKWIKKLFLQRKKAVFVEKPVVNFSYTGLTVTHRSSWKLEAEALLIESFPFIQKDEAHQLIEYIYRDSTGVPNLMALLQRARGEEQFLISISMFLSQKLTESSASSKEYERLKNRRLRQEILEVTKKIISKLIPFRPK